MQHHPQKKKGGDISSKAAFTRPRGPGSDPSHKFQQILNKKARLKYSPDGR